MLYRDAGWVIAVLVYLHKRKGAFHMNKNIAKTVLFGFAALVLSVAGSAFADDMGYLNSSGGIVKSGFGECWRTSGWAPEDKTMDCGAEPEQEPEPETGVLDSDGDGVPDSKDWCAGTPAGVEVDEKGCPLDSDGDGVPDYMDECPNTPANTRVDEKGCPLEGTRLFTLEGVHFAFDSDKLRPEAQSTLEEATQVLRDNRGVTVAIIGHTDSTGPEAYNQGLSERRAQSVYDYMVSNGIDSTRLRAYGRGESEPVASNETRAGRAENRRVEFVVEK